MISPHLLIFLYLAAHRADATNVDVSMMLAEVYEELGNLPQALTLVNYGELLFFLLFGVCLMMYYVVYKSANQNAFNLYQTIHSQTSQR